MGVVAAASPSAAAPARTPRRDTRHVGHALADDAVGLAVSAAVAPTAPANDPEALLLARCAAQIAGDAGAGAIVDAIAAPRQAQLLRDAVDAVASCRDDGRRRTLVYLPRTAATLLDVDELLALLRGLAARHPSDALLVVAVESSPHAARVPLVEQLARTAGWEICQLWSDGAARHALVVLERAVDGEPVRAS